MFLTIRSNCVPLSHSLSTCSSIIKPLYILVVREVVGHMLYKLFGGLFGVARQGSDFTLNKSIIHIELMYEIIYGRSHYCFQIVYLHYHSNLLESF